MFLTEEKLKKRIDEIEHYRYRDRIKLKTFQMKKEVNGNDNTNVDDSNLEEVEIGNHWRARDEYIWINIHVDIPKAWQGKEIVGLFDFGKAESLLYINDKPFQGIDLNHKEILLPAELIGKTVNLKLRVWSGLEDGGQPTPQEHQFKSIEFAWLDKITDDLYYTSKATIDTIPLLQENDSIKHDLTNLLNKTYKLVDWSHPGSEKFYNSVREANSLLDEELDAMPKTHEVTVHGVGHTHIDVAWLWRLKHTREKATRSFLTVLRLMEKFPEYLFLQTQPQLYEYIKEDHPEIYKEIKERVKEGRWEAEGGMWLEADCNVTSGESLVRQILMGKRFLKKEFDAESTYLWLPDVFGYSWALPQILRKSGIKTFMTTKISWSQYNQMPHDTFYWRGIDGTEILTHFITTPVMDDGWWFYTYNGEMNPPSVQGIWDNYKDKNINKDLLLAYGFGDGGGGVNREMLEIGRRIDKIPGLPNVKTTKAGDYFDKLHDQIESTDQYVHTWDGELYLEYHRGTYTSQAYNKRMNRKLELLYRDIEWLSVLGMIHSSANFKYPLDSLNEGWKIILRNQFHDIIPGSSIREVYEDSTMEYEEASEIGKQMWSQATEAFVSFNGSCVTVFNSSPWIRTDNIHISSDEFTSNGVWMDSENNVLDAEYKDDQWVVRVESIPSMGYKTLKFAEGKAVSLEKHFSQGVNSVTSPFYTIEWSEHGQLTSILDKRNNKEVLAKDELGNVLQVFEDKSLLFDAWDIDIFYQEKMREIKELVCVEVNEGALSTDVVFEWQYDQSKVYQKMVLYRDNPRIDFLTKIDWHEQNQLVKVSFPVSVRSTEATYDIQYGNVKRPTHWNTSWDYAKFETVGHQWADLSERNYGVSLLNDCKYGYDIKDNRMRLTLLKSSTNPDYIQDQGEHIFTYSLLPHKGDWMDGRTVKLAWELNNPLTYAAGLSSQSEYSLFSTDADNIIIDAVKLSEEDNRVVLRLHEFSGGSNHLQIYSDKKIKSYQECDLMENPIEELMDHDTLQFEIKPYEIKTFLIDFGE